MVKTLPSNAGGAGLMPGQGAGWRRQWQPTPVLLPGKSHGRRSLVGCSPWGREESDTTEQLHFHFSLSFTGEGNGNPLQCSCLENPRDGGARWAAVYGVAQGRTQLKWLSSLAAGMFYPHEDLNKGVCIYTHTHIYVHTCIFLSARTKIYAYYIYCPAFL